MLQYIADKDHYTEVLSRGGLVFHDLWNTNRWLKKAGLKI